MAFPRFRACKAHHSFPEVRAAHFRTQKEEPVALARRALLKRQQRGVACYSSIQAFSKIWWYILFVPRQPTFLTSGRVITPLPQTGLVTRYD